MRIHCCTRHHAIYVLVGALQATAALATDITWTGGTGNWTNAANWNPPQVPGAGDHVFFASGQMTVPPSATFSNLDWTGGSISGVLTVASNALLTLGGTVLRELHGSLINTGLVRVTGIGQFNLYAGPFENLPGGVIDFQADATWAGVPSATLDNAGMLRKSGGTGTTTIGLQGYPVIIVNEPTGTVQGQSGTIAFQGGGSLGGQFTTLSGARINLAFGSFTAQGSLVFSGSGQSQFTGGTLTLTTDLIPNLTLTGGTLLLGPGFQGGTITNLTLTGTLLSGTNTVTGTATLGGGFSGGLTVASNGLVTWTGGDFTGPLIVASNGVFNLTGAALISAHGPLTNAGLVRVTGLAQLNFYNGPIENLAGGVIDFQADATWAGVPTATLDNAGTLRKSGGTGTTTIGLQGYPVLFVNEPTGTVQGQSGTIVFQGGGSLAGQFTTLSSARINLALGSFTVQGVPVFSGSGLSQFTGGTLTLLSDVIPNLALTGGTLLLGPGFQGGTITNLTLTGTLLSGTNTVTGTATLGGGFSGGLTVANNGVVNGLAGTSQGLLVVAGGGTVNWTGGDLSGAIMVGNNGTLTLPASSLIALHGSLTNSGLVRVSGPGQLNVYSGPVENLASGLIDFQVDANWAGVPTATLDNAGTLRKSGGSGTTMIGLQGFPILFVNSGTVEADTGTLNIHAGYSNSPSGVLAISLGGAAPGSGYGRIDFTNPLGLGGMFTASTRNGFRPAPGQSFQVLSYPSATNTFSCMTGLDLGGGLILQPRFLATGLSLTAAAYATNTSLPQLLIARSLGNVAVQWPLGFPGWVLQTTTNIAAPVWLPVPGGCGNLTFVPVSAPVQYFRLHNGN